MILIIKVIKVSTVNSGYKDHCNIPSCWWHLYNSNQLNKLNKKIILENDYNYNSVIKNEINILHDTLKYKVISAKIANHTILHHQKNLK